MKRVLCLFFCLTTVMALPAAKQPNILFIYLDDFGWRDAGFMGSDFYETPNLDRLARAGLIFTEAYSCSANCAPARACLLSGQYTPRHGIFNVGTRPRGNAKHRRLLHIAGTRTLRPNIVTWAEALQQTGYRTGIFGKWHLGGQPTTQGFDVAVEHNKLPGFRGHLGPNEKYLADVLTDKTIEFIRENKNGPWCAYLPHYAVHVPLQAKTGLIAKYEAKEPGKLHNDATMAAMIQSVDEGVGRIIGELEQLGLREDTVIFFSSDNGGYGPVTDMAPLWGYKGTYYEGGIREPFFVNWPGVIKGGQTTGEPVIGVDLYPTFLEIAGARRPDQSLDGRSLVPLIQGKTKTLGLRPLFWHFPAYLESYEIYDEQRDPLFRCRPCSVVRLGDWKLHEYFEDGAIQLYNLRKDIGEQKDLARANPGRMKKMHEILIAWRKRIQAPVPSQANPKFDSEAERIAVGKALTNQSRSVRRKNRKNP